MASDDNSATDGRNAQLVFTPSATGVYKVRAARRGRARRLHVAGRRCRRPRLWAAVFYNNSASMPASAATAADDDAIATDKAPLLPAAPRPR